MAGLKQNRGTLLAAGGALLLGLLLLTAALVTLAEQEATFPEGSAEAVVQEYEAAIAAGDWDGAYALLAEELRQACPLDENMPMHFAERTGQRVTLQGSEMVGESLFVTVRVTTTEFEGPFGAGQHSFERRYALANPAGAWRFSDYPPPFYKCPEPEPPPEPISAPAT